jgi:spore maturation protein CgeB
MEKILKVVPLSEREDSHATAKWTFANYYLAMQVTIKEREHILKALSSEYDTAIYTPGRTDDIPGLRNLGTVDYYAESPYAMKCAKINLNITLRSIKCGIPLRIIDILGCGGFLLTNYQPDMDRHFVAGEDYVYYESAEDAVRKAAYYLEHEDERLRIAESGHRKVMSAHTYKDRVDEMIKIIYNI